MKGCLAALVSSETSRICPVVLSNGQNILQVCPHEVLAGHEATRIALFCLAEAYVGSKGSESPFGKLVELKKHNTYITFQLYLGAYTLCEYWLAGPERHSETVCVCVSATLAHLRSPVIKRIPKYDILVQRNAMWLRRWVD